MNRRAIALSVFAACVPSLAQASLKELPGQPPGISRDDIKAVERVERDCAYSRMSRMGPRPGEVARCEAAMQVATARGAGAARYALVRIGKGELGSSLTYLYQIIGRVADLGQVATLVKRLGEASDGNYERYQMAATLQAMTYADPKGTPSIAWQKWLDEHDLTRLSRADLLAERVAQMRTDAQSNDLAYALPAARWLSQQPSTRTDGIAALRALLDHPKLDARERRNIDRLLSTVAGGKPQSGKPTAALDLELFE